MGRPEHIDVARGDQIEPLEEVLALLTDAQEITKLNTSRYIHACRPMFAWVLRATQDDEQTSTLQQLLIHEANSAFRTRDEEMTYEEIASFLLGLTSSVVAYLPDTPLNLRQARALVERTMLSSASRQWHEVGFMAGARIRGDEQNPRSLIDLELADLFSRPQ